MAHRIGGKLSRIKKLALAISGFAVLAFPVLAGLLSVPSSRAQSTGGSKPSFEVTSVKPVDRCGELISPSPGRKMMIRMAPEFQPGRYVGCNTLKGFLTDAYNVKPSEISGGPDWSDSASFKIEAKADGDVGKEQLRLMLQSLLEERFKLKIRRETQETSVYSLIVAESGHKLQEAKDENGNPIVSLPPPEELAKKAKDAMRSSSSPPPGGPGTVMMRFNANEGQSELNFNAVTMKRFAEAIVRMVGRPVVDKTGLTGYYDITLRTALESMMLGQGIVMPPGPPPTADPVPKAEFTGPSIFTAVQEQLGLKLVADDAPMEFIVIASAEKPSEN